MDTQKIEIIGRNRLVNELLEAGFEVAEPLRDRGVDLIVYLDIDDEIDHFVAYPIQLKVSSISRFGVTRKYDKFPNLLLVYVWGIGADCADSEAVTYAMTQQEATTIAERMGWTETASWQIGYSARPSKQLLKLLEPYKMSPEAWRNKLIAMR